jgi:DNA-binding winged helix-turn-helix (wHTH) protein
LLYRFEDYVLDAARHELRRGDDAVPIEPKIFDLLHHLIENRNRLVTQEDLRVAVWQGRIVSASTLGSSINAARGAVGDSGEDQRLIQTVPRKGFRFIGVVREDTAAVPAPDEAASTRMLAPSEANRDIQSTAEPDLTLTAEHSSVAAVAPGLVLRRPNRVLIVATAVFAGAAIAYLAWAGLSERGLRVTGEQFDAARVPFVSDEDRRSLATYPGRPGIKVLAIGAARFAVVDGASDLEKAKQEAIEKCSTKITRCRIYAVGMSVVFSRASMPMAATADIRTEPLPLRLNADEIPMLYARRKRDLASGYSDGADHRALALTTGRSAFITSRGTRAEATRIALERCGDIAHRACLILSIDGFLTIEIPKSRKVDRIFLPSSEEDISEANRKSIVEVYAGTEWRALARGKAAWHAVAGAASEAAAVEAALARCAQADADCRLYAIGNFRVAQD